MNDRHVTLDSQTPWHMRVERLVGPRSLAPFPVYADLPRTLLDAHAHGGERDATVAHVLAAGAGYCYSDLTTVAGIASRLGLAECNCVQVNQAVDAMYIFSTACLVQSACGRVVILCYRGTEPTNFSSWMGDFDVSGDALRFDPSQEGALIVHGGFYRNFRATRWQVEQELSIAAEGRSLADPGQQLEHSLEALYVTGHSLGGAMAVLFALTSTQPALRAVYTYGQPMVVLGSPSVRTDAPGQRIFRHVLARDPVPALPPASFGTFSHVGSEFVFDGSQWTRAAQPTKPMKSLHGISRSLLTLVASGPTSRKTGFSVDQHAPHRYLDALRPPNRLTEFGD